MIKVSYEMYRNDYDYYKQIKEFNTLDDLKRWIFESMRVPYDDSCMMYFPLTDIQAIMFHPAVGNAIRYIRMIENECGILFSDGTHTSGKKHKSEIIQQWLVDCDEYRNDPKFNFI